MHIHPVFAMFLVIFSLLFFTGYMAFKEEQEFINGCRAIGGVPVEQGFDEWACIATKEIFLVD